MPDMDISEEAPPYQIAGILGERGAPPPTGGSSGGVTGVQTTSSKRPRDDGSPVCGKRGRGENGDISLNLKIPMPGPPAQVSSPAGDGDGGRCKSYPDSPAYCPTSPAYSPNSPAYSPSDLACSRPDSPDSPPVCSASSPPCSPALCESPKINQTPSSPAPFSGGAAAKSAAVTSGGFPTPAATSFAIASDSTACAPVPRRKGRVPHAAPPSLGATDPIFHAALLRVLHGRGGDHCAEAVGWRWKGDAPARFDHWPCALHPSVMDLLACVSASEEEVVMTGCDKKHLGGCGGAGGDDDDDDDENPPPPREAVWRAPRPRTPWAHRGGQAAAAAAAAAASTPSPAPSTRPGQTPLSALRKPGSACRLSSKNRVRFSTHDMSVVDTPDPQRGGSERGMISALGGLESILAAAEKVRNLAAPRGGDGRGGYGNSGSRAGSGLGDQPYEGYFDRFSATVAGPHDDADDGPAADEREPSAPDPADSTAAVSKAPDSSARDGSPVTAAPAARKEDDVDASLITTEAKSVREDLAKFVAVLDEIASSDAAPEEIALEGGWGPEHSNAAAFYAKELALLCGGGIRSRAGVAEATPLAAGAGAGVVGSHLRVRYLDVLSCLVRYNLKLLLNVCECEPPEEGDAMEQEDHEDDEKPSHVEGHGDEDGSNSNDDSSDDDNENENDGSGLTANLPAAPTPAAAATALTVIVPGRAVVLPEDTAWGCPAPPAQQLCGCVSVLDDKGALEFNTEDVAALLTLALGRVHPFMPLAARITVAAEAAGWDGGCGDETLDEQVWASVQEYTLENRAAAASSAAAAAAAGAATAAAAVASRAQLFSSPSTPGAMSPPPPVIGGRSVPKLAGRPVGDDATTTESSPSTDGAAACGKDEANTSPVCGTPSENDASAAAAATAVAAVELTADEAADLLEFVAAARFIAQLLAEPVVAAGVSAGRWSCAMRLSEQVRKLAEEEQEAQEAAAAAAAATATTGSAGAAVTSSLSNMLCLGALADVQGLGMMMAQQARYAPALEAALKRELRQALRRGQGLKRRIRHRLQPQHQHQQQGGGGGAPDVFSFPMVTPACQLLHLEGVGLVYD